MATRHDLGPLALVARDVVSDALGRGEHWDEHVYDELEPHLGGDVVDVGANVGALTLRFARVAPRVIAFEPNEEMYRALTENVRRLGLEERVVAINRGVYSYETRLLPDVTSYPPSSWTWLTGSRGTLAGPGAWPHMDRRVSAIKVDCQGADLHVLKGLDWCIRRDRPRIVFEFEEELAAMHGHTWDDYRAWLADRGYLLRRIADGHGDFIGEPA